MRKTLILVLVLLLTTATVAIASWKIADWVKGGSEEQVAGQTASAAAGEDGSADPETAPGEEADEVSSAEDSVAAANDPTGETFQYSSPDYRYVTETQRHQNFFIALAEGNVTRLDVTATDFQPVGDPNTSYVYFTISTTEGNRADGTMVMKFEGGLWRIGAIRQLSGDLGGGTNYLVPSSFEDDLARELQELQQFLTKMAEGRLAYMSIDSVSHPGECETVLHGKVVSKSGRTEPAEMRLRKDYSIWHITDIVCL